MAKLHGRNGRIYIGLASSSATAEPVANLTSWNINASTDQLDVTSMGDTSKTYLVGLPDAQITFEGYYDDSGSGVYTAATDGGARKVYLYPTINDPTKYWFNTSFVQASTKGGVNEAITISGTLAAATSLVAVGIT